MSSPKRKPLPGIVLAWAVLLGLFAGGGLSAEPGPRNITRPNAELAALNGKRLGILSGTVHDTVANRVYDYTQLEYYDDVATLLQALLDGEVDAVVFDDPVARVFTAADARFRKLPGNLQDDDYAFAVRPAERLLYSQIDSVMNDLMNEGVVISLVEKWIEGDPANRIMPPVPAGGSGDPLRFGVSSGAMPFVYSHANGRIIGLDIELAGIIAARLDRPLEVVDMQFSDLIPSLLDGELDMIGTAFSISKERARLVRFTRSYYRGGVSAIVRAEN